QPEAPARNPLAGASGWSGTILLAWGIAARPSRGRKSDVDFPANSVIGPFPHNPESLVRWCGALAEHHRGSHAPRGSWASSDRTGRWEALMAKPPGRGWLPGAGSLCWSWVLAAAVLLPNLVAGRCLAQSAPTANPPLPSSPTPPDS